MISKKNSLFLIVALLLSVSAQASLPLTGDVATDFASVQNCWQDEVDNDAGFDLSQVCFFYDGEDDTLSVGVMVHDGAVFGDADNDGDPDVSSNEDIQDFAAFGGSETFVISLDLDGDSQANGFDASTVDLLLGVSAESDVFGAFLPADDLEIDHPGDGFAALISDLDLTSLLIPSLESPTDLEFVVHHFKSLDLAGDYVAEPVLQIFTGSVAAGSVGSDFLPSVFDLYSTYPLYDFDSDGLEDWEELKLGTSPGSEDTDADGLLDGEETTTDPTDADSDDDGLLDGEEDLDHDGVVDVGETDPNDPDSDDDDLTDSVEVKGANPTDPNNPDTDDDALDDGVEDANHNGAQDAGETDPNKADTDAGGVNDYVEVKTGFDPLDPSDDHLAEQAAMQTGQGLGYDRVQGGGLFGCALKRTTSLDGDESHVAVCVLALLTLFVALRHQAKKR